MSQCEIEKNIAIWAENMNPVPNVCLHVSSIDEVNCNDTNKNVTSFSHPFRKGTEAKKSAIVGN